MFSSISLTDASFASQKPAVQSLRSLSVPGPQTPDSDTASPEMISMHPCCLSPLTQMFIWFEWGRESGTHGQPPLISPCMTATEYIPWHVSRLSLASHSRTSGPKSCPTFPCLSNHNRATGSYMDSWVPLGATPTTRSSTPAAAAACCPFVVI